MAINFPANPNLNDTFSVGNTNYVWDGTKWTASVTGGIALDKITEGNTSAEVVDTGTDGAFVVTTEGAERLRVDASGNVGVGSSNPQNRLAVEGSGSALLSVNSTSANGGGLKVQTNGTDIAYLGSAKWNFGGSYSATDASLISAAGANLVLGIGSTERLRIANTGAIGLSGANYGTSGQVLTSQGSGAAPQWATPSGGAWQFISSVTANNSASVAFTSGIDSTYDVYVITFTKVTPATDDVSFFMRTSSNGGSSYDSGGTDYTTRHYFSNTGISASDNTDRFAVAPEITSTTSTGGAQGTIYIFNAGDSGRYTHFNAYGIKYRRNTENFIVIDGQGVRKSAAVVNAIQFFMNVGNIASGTFRLYGIKNS